MKPHTHPLSGIKPEAIWDYFYQISRIPRGSGDEKEICRYICNLAEKLGLNVSMDDAGGAGYGNIIVRVEASAGYENAPVTIFQSHLDMVVLPAGMKNKPLELFLDGTVLRARGSTLGADNGIAVAMALVLMTDREIVHGPLELLFTIDEESGMTGARFLSDSALKGIFLINADGQGEGIFTVSSAGIGISTDLLPVSWEPVPQSLVPVTIRLSGGRGGHSGLEINAGRANAGQLLGRLLTGEWKKIPIRLHGIKWGTVMNAIPGEAEATILLCPGDREYLASCLKAWEKEFAAEFGTSDGPLHLDLIETAAQPETVMSAESQQKLLLLLIGLHHGIYTMSRQYEGTVGTSANIAVVRTTETGASIQISYRSSNMQSLQTAMERCQAVAVLAGATRISCEKDGGWEMDPDSTLLEVCRKAYLGIYGHEPEIKATHGTLECGHFSRKYPGMEIISLGTAIQDFHVPTPAGFIPGTGSDSSGERYDTTKMPQFWEFIRELLRALALLKMNSW
jgi:dipeptidase D